MRCVQVLSGLALRRLLEHAAEPALRSGAAATFTDLPHEFQQVPRALRQANARAWIAVELLLSGEALWERAQLSWKRNLDEEFFRPLRRLLDGVSLGSLNDAGLETRRAAAQTLRAAQANGLLTSGPLEVADLLASLENGSANADPLPAEWNAVSRLADHLEQSGYPGLRPLFQLRTESGKPFLVVMIAAVFQQAIADDPDLFGTWAATCASGTSDHAVQTLRPLAVALDRHDGRIDALLRSVEPAAVFAAPTPPTTINTAAGADHLQRGLTCAQRGEYEQAIGEYTAALQMDSASAPAFLHRGDAHRHKGDYPQALADYAAALRLDPASVSALIQRGQVHWTMGHVQEALADFNAVIQIEPRNAVAYHYRGKALAGNGDYDGAVVNFSEALRIDPFYAWAYHDSGEAYAAMGNFARAIGDFSEAIRLNPLTTVSYLRRGDAYLALQDFDRAVADYTNASRLDPQDPLAHQCLGTAYREQGKYDQAAAAFTKALECDYANGRLYFERGLLFQLQENHERALLDFNAAAAQNPADPEVYFRRGLTQETLGDAERALGDLSRALRLDPKHAAAYNRRGMLYAARDEGDLALADFNVSLELDPSLASAYVNRAKVRAQAGELGEAAVDCDAALALDPQMSLAYLVRGSVRAHMAAFPAAVDDFSQSLRLNPVNPQTLYLRGVANFRMDNLSQAMLDLTEAIRLDPTHARAYAQRAAIRQSVGKSGLALTDLAHAARLDAQFVPAYLRQLGAVHTVLEMYECAVADYTAALSFDQDDTAAAAGRDQAWQACLKRPKPRKRPTKAVKRLGSTQVPTVPATLVEAQPEQTDVAATNVINPQQTAVHIFGVVTSADMPIGSAGAPAEVHADAEAPHLHGAMPDPTDTSFTLNTPMIEDASAATSNRPAPATPVIASIKPDAALSVEALKEPSPPEQPAELTPEQLKARADYQEANRQRLIEEFRKDQEERKRREAAALGLTKTKKKSKRDPDEDDDKRWTIWKKGALIAASVVALYWVGSGARGFFSDVRRASKPTTTPLAGKIVGLTGNDPIADVYVRFHPKEPGGIPASALSRDDGTFKVSTFTRNDGIVPGSYVLTVEPPAGRATMLIPERYLSTKTSPLTVEINHGDTKLPTIKLTP